MFPLPKTERNMSLLAQKLPVFMHPGDSLCCTSTSDNNKYSEAIFMPKPQCIVNFVRVDSRFVSNAQYQDVNILYCRHLTVITDRVMCHPAENNILMPGSDI